MSMQKIRQESWKRRLADCRRDWKREMASFRFQLLLLISTSWSWMVSDHNLQPLKQLRRQVLPQLSQHSFNV
uniref:Uncharacterized protein n=1 Tax=Salix viminalis TaxID=40686 RepID=A0A6N2L672_SALVM